MMVIAMKINPLQITNSTNVKTIRAQKSRISSTSLKHFTFWEKLPVKIYLKSDSAHRTTNCLNYNEESGISPIIT